MSIIIKAIPLGWLFSIYLRLEQVDDSQFCSHRSASLPIEAALARLLGNEYLCDVSSLWPGRKLDKNPQIARK